MISCRFGSGTAAGGGAGTDGCDFAAGSGPPMLLTIFPMTVVRKMRQISPIKVTPMPIRQTNRLETSIAYPSKKAC